MWDTAGQERYATLLPLYTRQANQVIIVCDLLESSTWTVSKAVLATLTPAHKVVVVVNKCDTHAQLADGSGIAEKIANKLSLTLQRPVFSAATSAKSGQGLDVFTKWAPSLPPALAVVQSPNDNKNERQNAAHDVGRQGCHCAIA